MKILYIGVHSNESWRSEYWLSRAFKELGNDIKNYNYSSNRKKIKSWNKINKELRELEIKFNPDIIFLQRGKNIPKKVVSGFNVPIIFWSTEPLNLKSDADKLLKADIFSWVFVHSYSCLNRIKTEFPHLINISSIIHNACPKDMIKLNDSKSIFAIFNRNLSKRREKWLNPSNKLVTIINGKFGDEYFDDLRQSKIAINIHYSDRNLDDFETGIFEAMACGCAVISEKLNSQTLVDLGIEDAILQVHYPFELRDKIQMLKNDENLLRTYQQKSLKAIQQNTWYDRAEEFIKKFDEFI